MKYKSVIGFGKAYIVKDFKSKRRALDIIMQQYSDESFDYPKTKIKNTVVIKVKIEHMTGKIRKNSVRRQNWEIGDFETISGNLFKKKRREKML